ncbi:MAG: hypothetical protein ACYS32_02680 [Planctomycetota bacterium]
MPASPNPEPPTHGFSVRCPENVSVENTKTCETAETQLTPQLTPKSPKHPEIDTPNLPPDLAEIVAVWPKLPEHIKAAIKALVQTSKEQQ